VDYSTNTLSFERSLTWTANQGVCLKYAGAAPDIGAFEHGAENPVIPSAGTMHVVVNTRTSTDFFTIMGGRMHVAGNVGLRSGMQRGRLPAGICLSVTRKGGTREVNRVASIR
jgi:hypothetical protein